MMYSYWSKFEPIRIDNLIYAFEDFFQWFWIYKFLYILLWSFIKIQAFKIMNLKSVEGRWKKFLCFDFSRKWAPKADRKILKFFIKFWGKWAQNRSKPEKRALFMFLLRSFKEMNLESANSRWREFLFLIFAGSNSWIVRKPIYEDCVFLFN